MSNFLEAMEWLSEGKKVTCDAWQHDEWIKQECQAGCWTRLVDESGGHFLYEEFFNDTYSDDTWSVVQEYLGYFDAMDALRRGESICSHCGTWVVVPCNDGSRMVKLNHFGCNVRIIYPTQIPAHVQWSVMSRMVDNMEDVHLQQISKAHERGASVSDTIRTLLNSVEYIIKKLKDK